MPLDGARAAHAQCSGRSSRASRGAGAAERDRHRRAGGGRAEHVAVPECAPTAITPGRTSAKTGRRSARVGDHAGPAVRDRRLDAHALAQQAVEQAPAPRRRPPRAGPTPSRRRRRARRPARRCRPGAAASTRSPSCRRPGTGSSPARSARSRASAAAPSAPAPPAPAAAARAGRRRTPRRPCSAISPAGVRTRSPASSSAGVSQCSRAPLLERPAGEQPAALERLDRAVAGDEHARPGRPVGGARRQAVAPQRLELARAVLDLLRGGRDPQRADAPDERAQLLCEPVELGERLLVDADRALLPPGLDGGVVEQRAAGEQEAAVATRRPRRRPGRRRCRRRSRRPSSAAPTAASPDPPSPTTQTSASHVALERGGFAHAAGSPHTGWAAAVTRRMLPESPGQPLKWAL